VGYEKREGGEWQEGRESMGGGREGREGGGCGVWGEVGIRGGEKWV